MIRRLTVAVVVICIIPIVSVLLKAQAQEPQKAADGPLFRIVYDGRWGFIDAKGEIVIKPQFEWASDFCADGLAAVKVAGKYRYIDRRGQYTSKTTFDSIWGASDRPAGTRVSNRWAYMDMGGRVVVDARFGDLPEFSGGLTPVEVDGRWGYMNSSGEIVVKPQFYRAWPFRDGLGEVWVSPNPNTALGYIDKTGKYVWHPKR
jgi:hypothetical protein